MKLRIQFIYFMSLIAIIALCPIVISQQKILLTQNDTTEYRLMLGNVSSEIEQFAAQELQGYVMQSSGAFLPMAGRNEPALGKLILVGKSAVEKLGIEINTENLGPDGFIIRTIGDMIAIFGNSPRGTLYGVYSFLERIGCRWFSPGILGDVIPQASTITIDPIEHSEKASFEIRGFASVLTNTFNNTQWIDWMAKNRLNYIVIESTKYSDFKRIMRGETRRRGMYVGVRFNNNNDEKSPQNYDDVKNNVAQLLNLFISKNPEVDVIEINAETFKLETDKNCQKCLEIMNQIIQMVHEKFPSKMISLLIESDSIKLPNDYICPNKSFFSFDADSRCFRHSLGDEKCKINQKSKISLKNLSKSCGMLHVYGHYMGSYEQNSLPFPILNTIASDLEYFNGNDKINGLITQCELGNWGTYGLNYYVFARKAWNVRYNLGNIIDDFCEKYYSKASKSMKNLYATMEDAMTAMDHFQYINPPELILKLISENTLNELNRNIRDAQISADDVMVFDRIRKMQLSLEHLNLLWNMLDNYVKAIQFQDAKKYKQAKESFQKAIEFGEKLVKFIYQNTDEDVFIIPEDYIFNYIEPIITDARGQSTSLGTE